MAASAAPLARGGPIAVVKEPGLTPEAAEQKRKAIRESVADKVQAKEFAAAGDGLADNAALLGDPVTFIEAGGMYLKQAQQDRDVARCADTIEITRVGLDILYFYDAVATEDAKSTWLVIDPEDAVDLIATARRQIKTASDLAEEIEAEQAAAAAAAEQPGAEPVAAAEPKDRSLKPGTGLLIGGGAGLAVGVAGIAMAVAGVITSNARQADAEALVAPRDEAEVQRLDDESKAGNRLALIGAGVGVVGFVVAAPLLFIGAKKRKQGGGSSSASLRVAPSISRTHGGLSLRGRF